MILVVFAIIIASLSSCAHKVESTPTPPDPLEHIPSNWIDLPHAPFVAQMQKGKAVLIHRARTRLNTVGTGCVTEQNGSVLVVSELFGQDISDSYYAPGRPVEGLLRMVNNLDWYVANQLRLTGRTDLLDQWPPGSRIAVVSAGLRGEHEWSAAGTPGPR